MYCRSCNTELADGAIACTKCGKAPMNGNSFCNKCGSPTDPQAIVCVKCGTGFSQPFSLDLGSGGTNNRVLVGIVAIVLGALGIHKFLLGYTKAGIITIVITFVGGIVFGLGALAMTIVGIIEGITYLTKSDADFQNTYVTNKKEWF